MIDADDPFDTVMARIVEKWPQAAAEHYTTDDLAKIPPCPICGVRARIVAGRLYQPCIRELHSPPKVFPAPALVTPPVQRSFDDDVREHWWNR